MELDATRLSRNVCELLDEGAVTCIVLKDAAEAGSRSQTDEGAMGEKAQEEGNTC